MMLSKTVPFTLLWLVLLGVSVVVVGGWRTCAERSEIRGVVVASQQGDPLFNVVLDRARRRFGVGELLGASPEYFLLQPPLRAYVLRDGVSFSAVRARVSGALDRARLFVMSTMEMRREVLRGLLQGTQSASPAPGVFVLGKDDVFVECVALGDTSDHEVFASLTEVIENEPREFMKAVLSLVFQSANQ